MMEEVETFKHIMASGHVDHAHAQELMDRIMQRAASPAYRHQIRPLDERVNGALMKVCAQLPIRLASRISIVRFGPEGVIDPRFEVEFKGGKVIEFADVDEFPTDADIARIALECP